MYKRTTEFREHGIRIYMELTLNDAGKFLFPTVQRLHHYKVSGVTQSKKNQRHDKKDREMRPVSWSVQIQLKPRVFSLRDIITMLVVMGLKWF